jgi:predicted RNA-binding protein with PIN domain
MPYLVDGNNVMAQRAGWHRDRARARRELLDELARFARAKRVTVMAVFDGEPDDHFGDGASYMGVRVYYAERGADADERIKRLVESSRERRTLLVVTSDRALAGYVRHYGARVIRSGEFRRMMDEALANDPSMTGRSGADAGEGEGVPATDLDHWMRYFGVAPEDEE